MAMKLQQCGDQLAQPMCISLLVDELEQPPCYATGRSSLILHDPTPPTSSTEKSSQPSPYSDDGPYTSNVPPPHYYQLFPHMVPVQSW